MKNKLKAGVIIDALPLSAWESKVIQNIIEAKNIELVFVVRLNDKKEKHRKFLFEGMELIDAHLTHLGHLNPRAISYIRQYSLDWVLSLSRTRVNGEILDLPECGVWAYRHSSEKIPFAKDFYDMSSSAYVFFDQLQHDNRVRPLKQACISVKLYSYRQHMNKVEELTYRWAGMISEQWRDGSLSLDSPIYVQKDPSHISVGRVRIFGTEVVYRIKQLKRKLFGYEFWNVGTTGQSLEAIFAGERLNVEWFKPKKDLYYADPFVYRDGERWKIMMEEVDYRSIKGFITEWTITEGRGIQEQKATIYNDTHLSYPYLVKDNNELYCIPENSEAGRAFLYQWKEGWKPLKPLLENFPAVDSTLLKYQGRWWLFCTRASTYNGDNEELHLFYADDLLGEWLPHIANPVKVDVRSSRPAGTPFYYGDDLYRPAQDCSKTYGGAIVLNRIVDLSTKRFTEESVVRIEPDNSSLYPDGVHTFSIADGMLVVDGKRTEYRLKHFLKKLYHYRPVPLEKILGKSLMKGQKST